MIFSFLGTSQVPIIVKGLTSVAQGDFASENIIYYDGYVADVRKTFLTGTNTLALTQTEHGISTPLMFVGASSSSSSVNNDNSKIETSNSTPERTQPLLTLVPSTNSCILFFNP